MSRRQRRVGEKKGLTLRIVVINIEKGQMIAIGNGKECFGSICLLSLVVGPYPNIRDLLNSQLAFNITWK
jgi:hypothetical protein